VAARAALAAAMALALWPRTAETQGPSRPTLLVLLVVDQMRADYVTRYGPRWTRGLRRLVDEGAVYDQAFYPYLNTVTCAGHATLGTGAWPKTHGAIMNQWYDRALGALRTCTADPRVTTVGYGTARASAGHSAAVLRVPTLAERLRGRWRQSRAVTMSMKARSAIMMAGKGATSVTWWGEPGWQSSSAFGGPQREVTAFLAERQIESERARIWERLLPLDAYTGSDQGVGERPDPGWTAVFPHPLAGTTPTHFESLWEESPYSDAYLGGMAESAVRSYRLGQRGVVDFLGVSFSATDLVGHSFGPDSHEVQDTLARLDGVVGELLEALDRSVGRGRYALALSADHGVADVPEASRAAGRPGGRVPLASARAAVEKALAGLGAGPHVARVEYTQVYLTPSARARMRLDAVQPALDALRALPGLDGAVWNDDPARTAGRLPRETIDAVRAGHVPEVSGDISLIPAPNWILVPGSNPNGGDGTTHGSHNAYDQHVPLIFYGGPFQAGRYSVKATPSDAAPTLAATVGLPFRGVEGLVRHEAFGRNGRAPR
jgi:arylsulfatase A-like enzyme